MMYRMNILAGDDAYESWAHSLEEMRDRFKTEHPGVDFEVFLYGDMPEYLSLSEYRQMKSLLGDERLVRIYDRKMARAAVG